LSPRHNSVSWIALGISSLALCISAFQAWQTRRHDRLSVRPLIDFTYEVDGRERNVGLAMENVGLGPAVIRSITIYVDRKAVKDWYEAADYGNFKEHDLLKTFELDKDSVLKIGETMLLFGRDTRNKMDLDRFIDFVDQRLAVSITFCSIDDECQTRCSIEGRC